jgi:hypothetical protein
MSKLSDLIITPTYDCKLPSTGEKIKYRPFVVKEERALLMAQESEDNDVMLNTLTDIVEQCIKFPTELPELTTFDVEYLFVQIRMKSIEETSTLIFSCEKCNEKTQIVLQLANVYVYTAEGHTKSIKLDDNMAVEMRYPSMESLVRSKDRIEALAACVKTIYKGDTVVNVDDFTVAEVVEFLDGLRKSQFEKIEHFFNTIPETRLDLKWKCPKCGHDHDQVQKGLDSFF